MPKEVHYVKDSQLFPVVIEDFASRMDGTKRGVILGNAGGQEWMFTIQQVSRNQMPTFNMAILYDVHNWRDVKSLEVHYGFYIPNQHPDHSYFYQSRANLDPCTPIGTDENFLISELLDESNGYVKDGVLEVQVEIRVLVIIDRGGMRIRKFNFHDPFKGCVELKTQNSSPLYVSKKFVSHHFPFVAKNTKDGKCELPEVQCLMHHTFEMILQLLHGVPILHSPEHYFKTSFFIQMVHNFQVNNVMHNGSNELGYGYKWWRAQIHYFPINRKPVQNCEEREEIQKVYESNDEKFV